MGNDASTGASTLYVERHSDRRMSALRFREEYRAAALRANDRDARDRLSWFMSTLKPAGSNYYVSVEPPLGPKFERIMGSGKFRASNMTYEQHISVRGITSECQLIMHGNEAEVWKTLVGPQNDVA